MKRTCKNCPVKWWCPFYSLSSRQPSIACPMLDAQVTLREVPYYPNRKLIIPESVKDWDKRLGNFILAHMQ